MKSKISLRNKLLSQRLLLDTVTVDDLSLKINEKLIEFINWKNIKSIHIYKAIKSEVTTDILIDFLKKNTNIRIEIASTSSSLSPQTGDNYDLVITPLVAFDRTGNRLGYGGGYYDKFLADNHYKQAIGLAFSFQEMNSLPVEDHDQKLDLIITEKEIIKPE